jgi:hypothetical protein
MSTGYTPSTPVGLPATGAMWVQRELRKLFFALQGERIEQAWKVHHSEPERTFPTQTVYADGTDWNPGSGEGLYRRNLADNAWVHLG